MTVGQGRQEDAVDDGEDRDRGAKAEGQGQDRGCGEPGVSAKRADVAWRDMLKK